MDGKRPEILWPKSCQKKERATINSDHVWLLKRSERRCAKDDRKDWGIICTYSAERFRTSSKNSRTPKQPQAQPRSRRQQQIDRLVKERRSLRKQWKRASHIERKDLEALQCDLKQCLATLQRAVSLRKQQKKEQTRTAFCRDPCNFDKNLFGKEKSGTCTYP